MTREQLYNLVWSKPVSKILEEYAITQTGFKNLCKENDVPLPPNGHWQKLRHNKKVIQVLLPETNKPYNDIKLPGRIEGEEGLHKLTELALLIREIKLNKDLPLHVPDKLKNPDLLIKAAKEDLKSAKKRSSHGLEELYVTSKGVFNIYVSKNLISRALIFSDSFIKLMRKRGHSVEVRTNETLYNANGTKVILYGEAFEICVRENRKRVKVKSGNYGWERTEYVPTGVLTLRIEELRDHQWADSKTKKLEDKLPDILAYLELRAKHEIEENKRIDAWHREYERKKKIEEDFRKKREKELNDFKAVISNSSRWQKAMDLRNYIKVVEKDAIENNKLNEELKAWLKWVKDKADWYDPLIEKEDELFKGIDRDSI